MQQAFLGETCFGDQQRVQSVQTDVNTSRILGTTCSRAQHYGRRPRSAPQVSEDGVECHPLRLPVCESVGGGTLFAMS